MIFVKEPDTEAYSEEEHLRPEDVQYWDEIRGELKNNQRNKAKKFVEMECVQYSGDNKFICSPLPGYNTTTHLMRKCEKYEWRCSCQGYRTKEREFENGRSTVRPFCSHIQALLICFNRRLFDRWYMRLKEGDFT